MSERRLLGYVVVSAPPGRAPVAVETKLVEHPSGSGQAYGFYTKDEAEERARALQKQFGDPWIQPAQVLLLPEPAVQVKTPPQRLPGTGDIP